MNFRHTPDNSIFINDIEFTLDWFLIQEPGYSGLPKDCIARIYVPGKRHHLTKQRESDDALIQIDGGYDTEDFLWKEGDKYIAKLQTYVDAYELYINPPLTQEEIARQAAAEGLAMKREAALEELLTEGLGPAAAAYKAEKVKR